MKPDTLPNIAIYLDRLDSTEVMFDYVVDYIAKHPTIATAKDFTIDDADFEDFKQKVIKAGFTYDPVTEKQLKEVEKTAKFEGYYDDAKPEFEALKTKLKHNVARDVERNKETIKEMLEQDIVSAYYYQKGGIELGLRYDKQLAAAEKLLSNPSEYQTKLANTKQK